MVVDHLEKYLSDEFKLKVSDELFFARLRAYELLGKTPPIAKEKPPPPLPPPPTKEPPSSKDQLKDNRFRRGAIRKTCSVCGINTRQYTPGCPRCKHRYAVNKHRLLRRLRDNNSHNQS